MMQTLGSRYARYFNRRHQRTGGLFEDRYYAVIVDDERYWVTCLRYIELNPVRAGLVKTPDEYPWSSYRSHAFGSNDRLVTTHARYREFGATNAERQKTWQTMCAAALSTEELDQIRFAIYEQRVLAATTAVANPA
jgi:putative transposase